MTGSTESGKISLVLYVDVEHGINRNIVECKAEQAQQIEQNKTGINRNIVECKVTYPPSSLYLMTCINRNIVECKGTQSRTSA